MMYEPSQRVLRSGRGYRAPSPGPSRWPSPGRSRAPSPERSRAPSPAPSWVSTEVDSFWDGGDRDEEMDDNQENHPPVSPLPPPGKPKVMINVYNKRTILTYLCIGARSPPIPHLPLVLRRQTPEAQLPPPPPPAPSPPIPPRRVNPYSRAERQRFQERERRRRSRGANPSVAIPAVPAVPAVPAAVHMGLNVVTGNARQGNVVINVRSLVVNTNITYR